MMRCESLAQSDAHVTNDLIKQDGFPVEPLIAVLSASQYKQQLEEDATLYEFDKLLRKLYKEATDSGFSFERDSYGGYGLFYKGSKSIETSSPFRTLPSIVGLIERIPKELLSSFSEISIFKKTSVCRFDRIMLGPTRFANHSCQPNGRYLLKEENYRHCIRLEVIRTIRAGDEITVSYGDDFFGDGNQDCLCLHADQHQAKPTTSTSSFIQRSKLVLPIPPSRRRRVSVLRENYTKSKKSKVEMRYFTPSSSSSESDWDTIVSSSEEDSINEGNQNSAPLQENWMSSPNSNVHGGPPSFPLSAVDSRSGDRESSENSSDDLDEMSCTFSQENFSLCVNGIVSQHGTSDAEAQSWINLIKTAFPGTKIPAYKTIKRKINENMKNYVKNFQDCGDGECCELDFVSEIISIVKSNFQEIREYSSKRNSDTDTRIPDTFESGQRMNISLIMNCDGVRIINSKKRSLWPLWFSISNLPPLLRCKFQNIVLAKLWFGQGKPVWSVFFRQIKENLDQTFAVEYEGVCWQVKIVVKLLVADLPAKASLLNMNQFNAYFGCTLCLIQSKPIGEGLKGLYYPNKRHRMRTKEKHQEYLNLMESENLQSFRGVKGKSELANFIDNLPLSAPVDYMHQVLLGVTRAFLYVVKHRSKKAVVAAITQASNCVQLPREFKRSFRSLAELDYFKANELKVWLLYVGPVLFLEMLDPDMFERFHLLSYATRLLLSSREYCDLADKLIQHFHSLTTQAYSEKVFTANIHSLNHLAWQVKCFGPLWCTSAMMFESANYLLRCKFTGTINHLRLLVERYLRNKNCCNQIPQKDILYDLCNKLRNKSGFKRVILSANQIPNDLHDIDASFFGNQRLKNFSIDAADHSSVNFFVTFFIGEEKMLGQVRVFFIRHNVEFASLYIYEIIGKKRPKKSNVDIYSFYEAKKTDRVMNVSLDSISEKLLKIEINGKLYLIPLLDIFEHD